MGSKRIALRVVVVHRVGLGVVVVEGPFLERITASQFQSGWIGYWGCGRAEVKAARARTNVTSVTMVEDILSLKSERHLFPLEKLRKLEVRTEENNGKI